VALRRGTPIVSLTRGHGEHCVAHTMKYSERVRDIKALIAKMQNCEDVEDTLEMFAEAVEHIAQCEIKLSAAQGRYAELVGEPAPTAVAHVHTQPPVSASSLPSGPSPW
jgi:exonuclease VII small subunit